MVGVVVRPLSVAARRAVALAREVGAGIAPSLANGVAAYKVLKGFLLKITRDQYAVTVVVIDSPVRVVGDVLAGRARGGIGTTDVVFQKYSRDALFAASGTPLTSADPDFAFNVETETDLSQKPVQVATGYLLGVAPPPLPEYLSTFDNGVQGGAKENARIVTRLLTDNPDLWLITHDGLPPDTVDPAVNLWLEVETVSLSGTVDRVYIDQRWVRAEFAGYSFTSEGMGGAPAPLPAVSAYRRGARLVVAINVRKARGPYENTVSLGAGNGYSGGNTRDNGYSALLLLDGTLNEAENADGVPAYTVVRSHLWELATDPDPRLVPTLWHDIPPPYFDGEQRRYLGVASNDVRPVVAITKAGNILGAATVMCTRTALVQANGDPVSGAFLDFAPAQALVEFHWDAATEEAPPPSFSRTVLEATLHYSGAMAYEYETNTTVDLNDVWPWFQDYPHITAAITNGPPTYSQAYVRQVIEAEAELFISFVVLATTDDVLWELGVSYHRFKMADIGSTGDPLHSPGTTCSADLELGASLCVPYPSLYKKISLNDQSTYTWDVSGLKIDRYPALNGSSFRRGLPLGALGVDAYTFAAVRSAIQLAPGEWGFHGYPFDSLEIADRAVALMEVGAVNLLVSPPDEGLPGAEVDAPKLASVQRRVTDPEGVVTTSAGFLWTPGTNIYSTYNGGDGWTRVYNNNLAQIAFIGNGLWTLPNGQAAEI